MNHKSILSKDSIMFALITMVAIGSLYAIHASKTFETYKHTTEEMNKRIQYENKIAQSLSN